MIEMNRKKDTLALEIINFFNNQDFKNASEKAIELMNSYTDVKSKFIISADVAHLLCLSGDFKRAKPLLKELIDDSVNIDDLEDSVLEKLFLAYANCLYYESDYIRFYYYIHKYLNLAKDAHPEAYLTVKQLLA